MAESAISIPDTETQNNHMVYQDICSITNRYFGSVDGSIVSIIDSKENSHTTLNVKMGKFIAITNDIFCCISYDNHTIVYKITYQNNKYNMELIWEYSSWTDEPKSVMVCGKLFLEGTYYPERSTPYHMSQCIILEVDGSDELQVKTLEGEVKKICDDGHLIIRGSDCIDVYNPDGECIGSYQGRLNSKSFATVGTKHILTYTGRGVAKMQTFPRAQRQCHIHAKWKPKQHTQWKMCDKHNGALFGCADCTYRNREVLAPPGTE